MSATMGTGLAYTEAVMGGMIRFVTVVKPKSEIKESKMWPCVKFSNNQELTAYIEAKKKENTDHWKNLEYEVTVQVLDEIINGAYNVDDPVCLLLGEKTPFDVRLVFHFTSEDHYPENERTLHRFDFRNVGISHKQSRSESGYSGAIKEAFIYFKAHNPEIKSKRESQEPAEKAMPQKSAQQNPTNQNEECNKNQAKENHDVEMEIDTNSPTEQEKSHGDDKLLKGEIHSTPPTTRTSMIIIGEIEPEGNEESVDGRKSNEANSSTVKSCSSSSSKSASSGRPRGRPRKETKETPKLKRKLQYFSSKKAKKIQKVQTPEKEEEKVEKWSAGIPTFRKIKRLLEKSGYNFVLPSGNRGPRRDVYWLPGTDPHEKSKSKEGTDYFTSEPEFRQFLCAHGVPINKEQFNEEELDDIEAWVRYSVVKSNLDMPEPDEIDARTATKTLEKIGFRYSKSALGDGWLFPGFNSPNATFGDTIFNNDSDMYDKLSRNGLPGNCDLSIPSGELLALELFIARHPRDCFKKLNPLPLPSEEAEKTKTQPSEEAEKTKTQQTAETKSKLGNEEVSAFASENKCGWSASIPTFMEIKGLLERSGYMFDLPPGERCSKRDVYWLPGTDPHDKNNSKEGTDYFTSESDFRHFLCEHGVPLNKELFGKEELESIEAWVRYSVVKSDLDMLEPDPIDIRWATKTLEEIGFYYGKSVFGDGWLFPGFNPQNATFGDTMFNNDSDMYDKLSRNGLPGTCDLSIPPEELLALELFIARHPRDCFEVKHDDSTSRLRRRRPLDTLNDGDSSKIVNSKKVTKRKRPNTSTAKPKQPRRSSQSDESVTQVSLDSNGCSSIASTPPDTLPSVEYANGAMTGPAEFAFNNECSYDKIDASEDAELIKTIMIQSTSKLMISDGTFTGTDQEVLKCCLNNLKLAHCSESPTYDLSSEHSGFSKNLYRITAFLKGTVDEKLKEISKCSKSGAVYVCGVPGIGKTCGVKFCCTAVQKYMMENDSMTSRICFINASHLAKSSQPLNSFLEEIEQALGTKIVSPLTMDKLKNKLKSEFVFLVVDEIDSLVLETSAGGLSKGEGLIGEILKLANDQKTKLAFVGISNSMNDEKFERIQQLGDFYADVRFCPYTEDELLKILEARVGTTVFAPSCLKLIAKRVSQANGDARKALEMASMAASFCLDHKTKEQTSEKPLVLPKDLVLSAPGENKVLKEKIEGLPIILKNVLCVLTELSRSDMKITTYGRLRDFVLGSLKGRDSEEDHMNDVDFPALLDTLADNGLIKFRSNNCGGLATLQRQDQYKQQISLGIQLEEVTKILDKELQQTYFQDLRRNAVKNRNSS